MFPLFLPLIFWNIVCNIIYVRISCSICPNWLHMVHVHTCRSTFKIWRVCLNFFFLSILYLYLICVYLDYNMTRSNLFYIYFLLNFYFKMDIKGFRIKWTNQTYPDIVISNICNKARYILGHYLWSNECLLS